MRVLTRIALCVFLVLAGAAVAEVGPDGARALAAQLRAWLAGMLGPDAPELPIRAQVEGDHYRVVVPLIGIRTQGTEPAVTAAVHTLPDGRWGVDDVRLPVQFVVDLPAMPGGAGPGHTTIVVGSEHAHATIDPALRLPSSYGLDGSDLAITTTRSGQTQEQRVDRYSGSGRMTPAEGGLLDVDTSSEIDGWHFEATTQGGVAIGLGVRSETATAHIGGLRPSQVGPALAAVSSLNAALPAPGLSRSGTEGGLGNPGWSPAALTALHRLVEALPGIATALRIDETLQGLQVEIAGLGGATVDQVRFGIGGEAPAGMLRVWCDLGVEGLSLRNVPAAQAALAPRKISFRPSVSGIPVAALTRLLTRLTEPGSPDPARLEPQVQALFAQGSLTVGIEALTVDIGPAEFTGAGSVLLLSPTEREGQARIVATGFDALIDQARADPRVSAALPMLILARGLAKPDGDRLVWAIATDRSGKATVNGVDFAGMIGALGRSGQQP